MSTRWMAVQYVGDTLRLPIVNKSDMDKPFGSSELEREVRRIVVNPFSDNPQTFVPEAESAELRRAAMETSLMLGATWKHCSKLRELCADIYEMAYHEYPSAFEAAFADRMRELGIEVDG